ncbi:MAG: UDP-N-acetylglucosamine 2-epimerase (non-hydrolyzing) [Melioribacteraceae bacterium]|nr:UDP-N-acetylglucosamine 2-epimerase (non-hydrolyzing) [Melioribacteraceae bacterium]
MKKIISVVGARPNFMKVAPIHDVFRKHNDIIHHMICHTGQHYDDQMSKVFFEDLELPQPDFYLGVGSASHAVQTSSIMIEFEKVIIQQKPDLVIVVGDVNSTIACTLTAQKLGVKTCHVEAGLRSFDRSMPEEINRILTDSIADLLFVTEKSGLNNLQNEGVKSERVHFVGNVMIDSLNKYLMKCYASQIHSRLKISKKDYVLVTLHRPSNVDDKDQAIKLINLLNKVSEHKKIVFPIHPRTKKNWTEFKIIGLLSGNVIITEPIGYIDFIALLRDTALVLTDSGGIQEESTFLGIQCITLRNSTERPVTVDIGTNHLLGNDLHKAALKAQEILNGNIKNGSIPELWDGKAADRIVKIIINYLR